MSLPNDEVLELLKDEFVLGARNIEKDDHVGMSKGYKMTQTAVGTTNGAGGRNVQICVLSTDGTVLHVLPGFWHSEDLIDELEFALTLHELYRDENRTREAKEKMFQAMHRAKVRRLSDETRARSRWQGFDVWYEVRRAQTEPRDTVELDENGKPVLDAHGQVRIKPICDLVHERMAARPFLAFEDFDMEAFVDYGRPYYDNNSGLDRGKKFTKADRINKKREKARAKELEEQAKAAKKARIREKLRSRGR